VAEQPTGESDRQRVGTSTPRVPIPVALVAPFVLSLGFLSLPAVLVGPRRQDEPLLVWLSKGVESTSTPFLLILCGVVVGIALCRHRSIALTGLLGASSCSGLFAYALAGMTVDPTSHNLWPLEFALYALFGPFPGMIGALLGRAAVRQALRP
jgi:hypothetical protein